jgi:cytochrome c-type biogenesis protein
MSVPILQGLLVCRRYVFLTASLVLLLASACAQREDAIDFQVTLYNGETFQLAQQAGRSATVVNFWYPSCPPCREEMPHFEEAWQDLQHKDVRFLGLFVPMGFDSEQDARDFIAELGLTFDFATDRQALIAQSYQVEFFPTTYFIDKDGKVFKMQISNLDTATITSIVNDMEGG